MSSNFLDSLSADLEDQDFRVRVLDEGYRQAVNDLRGKPGMYLDVSVSYDFVEMLVRFFPTQKIDDPLGDDIVFTASIGELLDQDGQPTGRHVDVYYLRIELDEDRIGKTVGSLRMRNLNFSALTG